MPYLCYVYLTHDNKTWDNVHNVINNIANNFQGEKCNLCINSFYVCDCSKCTYVVQMKVYTWLT